MRVIDLMQALDLVGEVSPNADKRKLTDAIFRVKSELSASSNMTLAEWAVSRKMAREIAQETNLETLLAKLESHALKLGTQVAYGLLEYLTFDAATWRQLALLATGKRERSKVNAKFALRSHLASRAQSQERREGAARWFQ
jgi:hypothetical protein